MCLTIPGTNAEISARRVQIVSSMIARHAKKCPSEKSPLRQHLFTAPTHGQDSTGIR
jgi:hypothetical protein